MGGFDSESLRGYNQVLRQQRGVVSNAGKLGHEISRFLGDQGGTRSGWYHGLTDGDRYESRHMRYQQQMERHQNRGGGGGYGQRSKGRYGGGSGFSDEELIAIAGMSQNEEVRAELEKYGLSPDNTMWDGLDTASPHQIIAAARTVEQRHEAEAKQAASQYTAPSASPSASTNQVDRADYEKDLQEAVALQSPHIMKHMSAANGNPEVAWEMAVAEASGKPGEVAPDYESSVFLKAHLQNLRQQRATAVSQPAPAATGGPTILAPGAPPYPVDPPPSYSRAVTSEPLPPVGASAASAGTSFNGLNADGAMHFDTYGGLYRGMYDNEQVETMQRMMNIVAGTGLAQDGDYGSLTGEAVNRLRQNWGMGQGHADADFLNRLSGEYNQLTLGAAKAQAQQASLSASIGAGEQIAAYTPPPPPPTPTNPQRDDFRDMDERNSRAP